MYVPSTRTCPVCVASMKCLDDDSRQEWYDANYYCLTCDVIFTYRYTFEIQSDIIHDEGWLQVPSDPPFFNKGIIVYAKLYPEEQLTKTQISRVHVSQSSFDYHYHIANYKATVEFAEADLSRDPREAILLDALYVSIVETLDSTAQEAL